MRFLVLGLGPNGGILAAHLAAAGHEVFGVDPWKEHIEAVRRSGIRIGGFHSLLARPTDAATSIDAFSSRSFDWVIIAVKTPLLPAVTQEVAAMKGHSRVVAFQNGIDNEDYLARYLDGKRILRAAIHYAGIIRAPGEIDMTFFQKPNYLGCICGNEACRDAASLADLLTGAGLDTAATDDIKHHAWRKTILNAALGPIAAILGQTMEEVMSNEDTFHLVELVVQECIEIARNVGHEFGQGFHEYCLDYLRHAGNHKPSMLIDLERGRPTEIDFINGRIAAYGHGRNVPSALNTALTALVKAKESQLGQGAMPAAPAEKQPL